MLSYIILFSLRNRALVLVMAFAIVFGGIFVVREMSVDVFPDLNRPMVTIMTEAPGLAPEEVEALVTRPIELVIHGATGVKRVRSSSAIGLSIVWVEFEWNTDVLVDRQIVGEKIQLAKSRLPPDVNPVLAPVSSIMGEIVLLALRSDQVLKSQEEVISKGMELRTLGEFTVRNRLLAIEGVSQVTVMGGTLKQYQIITTPARLAAKEVTLRQLTEAAKRSNVLAGGGVMVRGDNESLLRIQGMAQSMEEIASTPVVWRDSNPVLIRDVADVRMGGPIPRGDGSAIVKLMPDIDQAAREPLSYEIEKATFKSEEEVPGKSELRGGQAVLITIQKQPAADTLDLDRRIAAVIDSLRKELPPDISIENEIFRQAHFIEAAVDNVTEAVRDGAVWVIVVLFLLMGNIRSSVSSLISMPLSILLTILVFYAMGITINTMTLGGIAVAIGDLVDDSIVDIENIYRRLKENQLLPIEERKPTLEVVYLASCEVRNSIVYATLIVSLVVCPLFMMIGLEGRLFAPLAIAYIISLLSSLVISLTVTPVLASFLLHGAPVLSNPKDPWLLRWMKYVDENVLRWTLRRPRMILSVVAVFVFLSCSAIPWMGGEFLPAFHEGTATINLRLEPGTSLQESQRLAGRVEGMILQVPEVISLARRTGRAELDEHAEGVNNSEFEVANRGFKDSKAWMDSGNSPHYSFSPFDHLSVSGSNEEVVFADIRDRISNIPGAAVNIGQPISHRLDHMISGIRAQVAIKVFGPDLQELRTAAYDIQARMQSIQGVVDLQIEPQTEISQLRLRIKRDIASRFGLSPGDIAELLQTAYQGRIVSQVLEEDRAIGLVVWYDETARSNPTVVQETILETPSGRRVALGQVVEVLDTTGPNVLNRENVQRRLAVSCNVEGRDLSRVVSEIRSQLQEIEVRLRDLPGEYSIEYSGQFEAQQAANRRLAILACFSCVGVFLLLYKSLRSWKSAMQVIVNIPLAAFGAVVALLWMNQPSSEALAQASFFQWPLIWVSSTHLSLAHWIGFRDLDRNCQSEWDHDDLPLHSLDGSGANAIRGRDDCARESRATLSGGHDCDDQFHRSYTSLVRKRGAWKRNSSSPFHRAVRGHAGFDDLGSVGHSLALLAVGRKRLHRGNR